MSVFNKAIWVAGLLCAIIFILITGQINKRNYEKIQLSIEEIYKDRLVVKGLIYDLSSNLYLKKLALVSKDETFFSSENANRNLKVKEDLIAFRATKLTPLEDETLGKFSVGFKKLVESEKKFGLEEKSDVSKENALILTAQIEELLKNLDTLAGIQLEEGKKKVDMSSGAVTTMNFFERVENYFLLVLGILILIIIFLIPGDKKREKGLMDSL